MADSWRPSANIAVLKNRAEILAAIRTYFADQGVLEVQTPLRSQSTVSDPATRSLAVADGTYLQTSPEYQMKRLLAAGAPSIYQMSPVFRAGEQGRHHSVEFSMLEWYRVGWDHNALMQDVGQLVNQILGDGAYQQIRYAQLINDDDLIARAADDISVRDDLDVRLDEAIRDLGQGRWFVTHFPAAQAALARLDATDPSVASRFELIVDGLEIANGYHELCDAQEMEDRISADNIQREQRNLPQISPDQQLLAAMRSGLPDCAGVAVGVDRLVMLALGLKSIEEALSFVV
jgi:lysyl-tRNA synthetase class 2